MHPENYPLVEKIAADQGLPLQELMGNESLLKDIDLSGYQQNGVGEYTLRDILEELRKPGRDPRQDHQTVQFDESVSEISDLSKGIKLPGVITNVTHFGVFVDIGVHQDGLVHISQLSRRYVRDPMEVCSVGQQVEVFVLEVDEERKRISLSMNNPKENLPEKTRAGRPKRASKKKASEKGKPRPQEKPGKAPAKKEKPEVRTTGNFEKDLALLMEKFNQQ